MPRKKLGAVSKPVGRPSIYTDAVVDAICERMIMGESLVKICADPQMPSRPTVYAWFDRHPEFHTKCARAREGLAEVFVDKIMTLADETTEANVQSQKVKISTAQWLAMKMAPRIYGDRTTTQITGDGGGPVVISQTIDVRRLDADSREAFKQALLSAGKVIEHDPNEGDE
jgi:hypothetical protein